MVIQNFFQLQTFDHQLKLVNIFSIALLEDLGPSGGTRVTMKERNKEGNNISFVAAFPYVNLTVEIQKRDPLQG